MLIRRRVAIILPPVAAAVQVADIRLGSQSDRRVSGFVSRRVGRGSRVGWSRVAARGSAGNSKKNGNDELSILRKMKIAFKFIDKF